MEENYINFSKSEKGPTGVHSIISQEGQKEDTTDAIFNGIKIIKATYKVLDFFPESDPLKYKAKEKTLEVFENLTLLSDAGGWISLKKEKASAELLDDIEILKNYLKLGKYQEWVGDINFLILLKEYDKIKSHIRPPRGNIKQKLAIISEAKDVTADSKKKKEKGNLLGGDALVEPVFKKTDLPKNFDEQGKNSIRQEKILNIISKMGKAQVSDIIKEIPNVTKRTIRRDLDELLKREKIVRKGDWNKIFYEIGR